MGTTRFSGPVLTGRGIADGLFKDVPLDIVSRRNVCGYFLDFIQDGDMVRDTDVTNQSPAWNTVSIGTPTSPSAGPIPFLNGAFQVTSGTAANTGNQAFHSAAAPGVGTAGSYTYVKNFGFISYASLVTTTNMATGFGFIGITNTTNAVLTTAGALTSSVLNNWAGFRFAGSTVQATTNRNNSITSTTLSGYSGVIATPTEFGIRIDCGSDITSSSSNGVVKFYINGVVVATHTNLVPYSALNAMFPVTASVTSNTSNTAVTHDYISLAWTR